MPVAQASIRATSGSAPGVGPAVTIPSEPVWPGTRVARAAQPPQTLRVLHFDPQQQAAAQRLAAILKFMAANLSQPIRVPTLSAMAGLGPARFFELFKLATGDTPLNWIIQARMRVAAELLERSELQIKEIAGRVGYEDQFYFSRLFKAVHGIAPSGYRARGEAGRSTLRATPGSPLAC